MERFGTDRQALIEQRKLLGRLDEPHRQPSANDAYSSEDVAQWLKDAGRRPWAAPKAADKDGRASAVAGARTRVDEARTDPARTGYRSATSAVAHRRAALRRSAIWGALVLAFLQYYFLDIHLQIARLPAVTVFVPVASLASGSSAVAG
jgi:hypothetical protein